MLHPVGMPVVITHEILNRQDPSPVLVSEEGGQMHLRQLGVPEQQIKKGDASEIGVSVMRRLFQLSREPKSNWQWKIPAYGLDEAGVDTLLLQRLSKMGPKEQQEMVEHFGEDKPRMDMTPEALKGMQDFNTQLERSSTILSNTFYERISGLSDPLTKFSEALTNLLGGFLAPDGPVAKNLPTITVALNDFADYMKTNEFQQSVRDFVKGVGEMIAALS